LIPKKKKKTKNQSQGTERQSWRKINYQAAKKQATLQLQKRKEITKENQ
jgi:hypothetical protein